MNKDKGWRERFKEHWDKRFGDSVLMWKWRDELIELVDQALQDKEREIWKRVLKKINEIVIPADGLALRILIEEALRDEVCKT